MSDLAMMQPSFDHVRCSGDWSSTARPAGRFIANSAIAFAAFLGGFVIFEPAPYELFLSLLLGIWVLFHARSALGPALADPVHDLQFRWRHILLQIPQWDRGVIYVAVSYFLALSSVFSPS
ncbi:MAG: hypothetical protein R3D29_07860 [Nitratireductor sp.]